MPTLSLLLQFIFCYILSDAAVADKNIVIIIKAIVIEVVPLCSIYKTGMNESDIIPLQCYYPAPKLIGLLSKLFVLKLVCNASAFTQVGHFISIFLFLTWFVLLQEVRSCSMNMEC